MSKSSKQTKLGSETHSTGSTSTDIVATAKNHATKAVDEASTLIAGNPLVALIGGIAIGAAAGALVPRSDRETALLAPFGDRIADATRAALAAGREAGSQALIDSGLTVDGLRDQVAQLFGQAIGAANAAGTAALSAARDTAKT